MIRNLAKRGVSGSASSYLNSNSWTIANPNQIQLLQKCNFSSGVLPDNMDRNSEAFARYSMAMEGLICQLQSTSRKFWLEEERRL
ncbi:Methylcrotonyl-CoA carboxylase beta chain family protein [Tripterygium wilfordii]|uniref:Methylcrotonyl-CoA carboxylase beta chain family protein n=1 Tax=Tripterygium wilfordii TaxID=458696 RepID=A0A7J7DYQ1_TRIWF|nr:Methylcrotonyl-CoA carboxylase beta chain family protein [Tripterygium wilfordii]